MVLRPRGCDNSVRDSESNEQEDEEGVVCEHLEKCDNDKGKDGK